MNDDNKYYLPNIEDFRVGYEYEFQGIPKGWHKMIFSEENNLKTMKYNIEMLKDAIRVPYLTKEQIEKEGWKDITLGYQKPGLFVGEKIGEDDYLNLCYCFNSKQLQITLIDDSCLFYGDCKSVNELRYITKLLKI